MALTPTSKASWRSELEKLKAQRNAKGTKLDFEEKDEAVTDQNVKNEDLFDDEFEDNEKLCLTLDDIEKEVFGNCDPDQVDCKIEDTTEDDEEVEEIDKTLRYDNSSESNTSDEEQDEPKTPIVKRRSRIGNVFTFFHFTKKKSDFRFYAKPPNFIEVF